VTTAPILDLDQLVLKAGGHSRPEDGMCFTEAAAYLAGEPFSDHPACVSPVIAAFGRTWNDGLPDDDRQMLKPYVPKIIGTATTKADDEIRAWMCTDWLARECAPAFLRLAGLTEQAELLERLAPIVDTVTAKAAQPTLNVAKKDAAAARAAAWDAARAAAWDAAWAAAWDAARAAAWAAARAAKKKGGGYDAQYQAAYAAAKPLVDEKFGETTKGLQTSALLLLDRMIAVGQKVAA
jgi:hypothetical protein